MVAQVIVNRTVKTLNREFHYLVPKKLENQIQIGNRAIVPFGNKSVEEGFVIGLIEKSDFATKEIKSISFGLTEDNINLAKLMSKRYFCNIIFTIPCQGSQPIFYLELSSQVQHLM